MSKAKLTRSRENKMLAGVSGGLADYLDIDPVFVRLAFLVLLFASGIGLPIYLILWIVMPLEGQEEGSNTDTIQKNIGEMGDTVYTSVNRFGRPGTVGVVLVLLGAFFLLSEFGLFGLFGSSFFWPLLIIGIGIFVLVRRSR